jgi:hypothetical protein
MAIKIVGNKKRSHDWILTGSSPENTVFAIKTGGTDLTKSQRRKNIMNFLDRNRSDHISEFLRPNLSNTNRTVKYRSISLIHSFTGFMWSVFQKNG